MVTVLVPTHDHGPTLRFSVASALAQTHSELEVLIVGDGMPDDARAAAREVARSDERVRLLEFDKGPRHGEIHRHAALAEASGERIFYLADDDLWLPDHVETLLPLIDEADFVGGVAAIVYPDGSFAVLPHDLSRPEYRELLLDGRTNRLPLAATAHTLSAYRELTPGWRTTPDGTWTDLFFHQRFLGQDRCVAKSAEKPTCLCFVSPARTEMTVDQRVDELERWSARVADPTERRRLEAELAAGWRGAALARDIEAERQRELALDQWERTKRLTEHLGFARAQVASVQRQLDAIRATAGWQALERLRTLPGAAIGRALARRWARRRHGKSSNA